MIVTHILHFLPVQVLSALLVEHGRIEFLRVDLECRNDRICQFSLSHEVVRGLFLPLDANKKGLGLFIIRKGYR